MPTRRVHAPLASDLVGSWRMEQVSGTGVIYAPTSPTSSTAFISANLSRHPGILRATDGCGYQIVNWSEPKLPVGVEDH